MTDSPSPSSSVRSREKWGGTKRLRLGRLVIIGTVVWHAKPSENEQDSTCTE